MKRYAMSLALTGQIAPAPPNFGLALTAVSNGAPSCLYLLIESLDVMFSNAIAFFLVLSLTIFNATAQYQYKPRWSPLEEGVYTIVSRSHFDLGVQTPGLVQQPVVGTHDNTPPQTWNIVPFEGGYTIQSVEGTGFAFVEPDAKKGDLVNTCEKATTWTISPVGDFFFIKFNNLAWRVDPRPKPVYSVSTRQMAAPRTVSLQPPGLFVNQQLNITRQ